MPENRPIKPRWPPGTSLFICLAASVLCWVALVWWQPWVLWYLAAIFLAGTLGAFLIADLPPLMAAWAKHRRAKALIKKGIVPRGYGVYRLTRRPFD